MVRALANVIMRSRFHAALMAMLGTLIPMLGTASVGLVALRKGFTEGTWIVLAALLPMVVALWWRPDAAGTPMAVWFTAATLVLTLASAQLLRVSRSWPITLVGSVAFGTLAVVLMPMIASPAVVDAKQMFVSLLSSVAQQQGIAWDSDRISDRFVLGIMAYASSLTALLSVMLSRWMQAMLFNPGGFRSELHQLRLPPPLLLLCLGASLLSQFASAEAGSNGLWPSLFMLPVHVAGLGLLHWLVAFKGWRTPLLVGFYVALLIVPPIATVVLTAVAVADSFLHLRLRIAAGASKGDE